MKLRKQEDGKIKLITDDLKQSIVFRSDGSMLNSIDMDKISLDERSQAHEILLMNEIQRSKIFSMLD